MIALAAPYLPPLASSLAPNILCACYASLLACCPMLHWQHRPAYLQLCLTELRPPTSVEQQAPWGQWGLCTCMYSLLRSYLRQRVHTSRVCCCNVAPLQYRAVIVIYDTCVLYVQRTTYRLMTVRGISRIYTLLLIYTVYRHTSVITEPLQYGYNRVSIAYPSVCMSHAR